MPFHYSCRYGNQWFYVVPVSQNESWNFINVLIFKIALSQLTYEVLKNNAGLKIISFLSSHEQLLFQCQKIH
ncbi:hypothetical protein SAMN04487891_105245 [Flagellimonas taeanensis]|uniref:Uncharacterized protein n=1 Tax=Flagellimonas taeanensis TaxID=1005926 RepID=A0A1M6YER4_9FLAO|nr:hypothetical protein SAMN04487891_105245 [Allomuricauda taeanensis]SHL16632.1 hypothetical protein SAMN05216293_2850 [Allomuricauda taeanensis]